MYLPNEYSQQRQKEKPSHIYPVRMAMECEKHRQDGDEVVWYKPGGDYRFVINYGDHLVLPYDKIIREPENLPFPTLPRPDRVFTRAKEYTSGNYKYLPGTHILSASGCWWGNCTFCVEHSNSQDRRHNGGMVLRPVEDVIGEIEECKSLGFKEVFDDSASFPTGEWLHEFIRLVHARRITMHLGCNARIGSLPFADMHAAGFRMLLFGLESASQYTLDRINKGVKVEDIIPTISKASDCGLDCHGAFMFGYPWETEEDARRTLKLCHYLLRKGYLKTAQASLYCPQGSPGNQAHKKFVKKIYDVGFDPRFWITRLRDIKTTADIKYLAKGIRAWLSA